ncbi:MAG: hypothetical protein JW702_06240 [Clostridiales bacterium]|nr:hypothetical protein [Clostridiales bacterium]
MKEIKYKKEIEAFLHKDEIVTQNILGIIENIDHEKLKFFVDDEVNISIFMMNDGFFNYVFTQDKTAIGKLKPLIDSFEDEVEFSAVSKEIADEIIKMYSLEWEEPCYLYYIPYDKKIEMNVKDYIEKLQIKNAEEVNEYYTYKNSTSLDRIKNDILKRESSCVNIDNELRSWVLVHEDNSMGIMYTKKEYLKMGYAHDLTLDLAKKLLKQKKMPFINIVVENFKSIGLAEKSGFQRYGEVVWFGIRRK